MTPSHVIMLPNGGLAPARDIQVGQTILNANGDVSTVHKIEHVNSDSGLYL